MCTLFLETVKQSPKKKQNSQNEEEKKKE